MKTADGTAEDCYTHLCPSNWDRGVFFFVPEAFRKPMVKCSYEQKSFRREVMRTYGASVTPSP